MRTYIESKGALFNQDSSNTANQVWQPTSNEIYRESLPWRDVDGGPDDPLLLLPRAAAVHDGHGGPGADEEGVVIPLLDADPARAVRPLHPHGVRAGAGDEGSVSHVRLSETF